MGACSLTGVLLCSQSVGMAAHFRASGGCKGKTDIWRKRPKPWNCPIRKCLHLWRGPRSSKPRGGLTKAPSGFDSHTLPLQGRATFVASPFLLVIYENCRCSLVRIWGQKVRFFVRFFLGRVRFLGYRVISDT